MEERFTVRCAVHLFLIKDNSILVEKRKNRTYCNGQYDVIASHILGNEDVYNTIINTAKKEVNIEIKRQDITPIQVMHHKSDECEYIHYFFITDKYQGEINNNEPEICERLEWVKFKYPIDNMMEYINYAIKNYLNNPNDNFTVFGFTKENIS